MGAVPPRIMLVTTGEGQHRFNPNLYQSGKVCLSLLGTWEGEPWDPHISTLYQVFVSIYGLIFVEQPYFNEPGYQVKMGTAGGDIESANYNVDQRIATIKYAMLPALKKPNALRAFSQVVEYHYTLQAARIRELAPRWAQSVHNHKPKILEAS